MKASDIVGKTVAKVEQYWWSEAHTPDHVLQRVVFTDGTILYFSVVEGEDDYGVRGHVLKPERGI